MRSGLFVLAALLATSSALSRQLTPRAQELLERAANTVWRRELDAASAIVSSRRRRGRRRRLRPLPNNDRAISDPSPRHLQKYNDYLPEDAPESLIELASSTTTSSCLSPLQRFFIEMIDSIGLDAWDEIEAHNVTSLAYLYKHHVSGDDGTQEYFGTYGDRTAEMTNNHHSLGGFWASSSYREENVVLLGMHGVDLADDARLVPTLQQLYGLDGREAHALGRQIQSIVQSLPGAFNHPILTTNAVAVQSLNPDGSMKERDSIIVGDGVFAFLEWLDLRDDGPDYIHAHEYGHHLQYEMGLRNADDGTTAGDDTRRWEMTADALGAYYLAHAHGGQLDAPRMTEVHRAAFSLGDCEDVMGTHHGTPRQRECASRYGANMATASWMDGGHTLSPRRVRQLFEGAYAKILALDEEECGAVLDAASLDAAVYGENAGESNVAAGVAYDPPEDLETPWNVPAPSPASASGYAPQSEYKPFDAAPQSGWGYGTPFEAYDPEEYDTPANKLDEPPPRVQNGTYAGDGGGWFGGMESQWVSGRTARSDGTRWCVRWAFAFAALTKILLLW